MAISDPTVLNNFFYFAVIADFPALKYQVIFTSSMRYQWNKIKKWKIISKHFIMAANLYEEKGDSCL